jgi:formylglycine-generating enzyme required for sulfatase activity
VEESYIIHLESAGVPLVPEMVRVKAGKVSISAACGDISVARDFSIGTYPVTQDQFASVMGFNPSMFKGQGRGSHPVEGTTWFDAVMYCNKLSKAEGLKPCYSIIAITYYGKADAKGFGHPNSIESAYVSEKEGADGYRLPTRDEWVYAERGGSQSKAYEYSGSDNLDEVGWYWQNSGDEYLTGEDGSASAYISVQKNNNRTHPVGMKKPNELGIYGMSGHVEEWTGSAGHGWPEVRMYCGNSYWKPFYMIRLSERKRFLNRREARQYSGYSGFRIAR